MVISVGGGREGGRYLFAIELAGLLVCPVGDVCFLLLGLRVALVGTILTAVLGWVGRNWQQLGGYRHGSEWQSCACWSEVMGSRWNWRSDSSEAAGQSAYSEVGHSEAL